MVHKSSYNFSADVIRVLAIIGVIIIHTLNAIYTRPDFFGGTIWWIAIILNSLARVSIPLFIMLSGYLLLKKDEDLGNTWKRICTRIIVPLLFWIPFYFWLGTGAPSFSHFTPAMLQKIVLSNVYHLYFLIIMLGLYFITPIIRGFLQTNSQVAQSKLMKGLLIVGIIEVALQFLFHACGTENIFTRWIPFVGYFVAGYVLGNTASLIPKRKLFFTYLSGLGTTIVFNYLHFLWLTRTTSPLTSPGCLSHYTDHYVSINVVVMSLSAFLLLRNTNFDAITNTITRKVIHSLARASFGMYLLQPVVARFLEIHFHLAVDFSTLPIMSIIALQLVLVFCISYGITIIACKIPFVKMVFGEK